MSVMSLEDFIGKEEIKRLIRFKIESAKKEGKKLPNMIISGPGGTGKTTLAHIIATEMGVKIHEYSARTLVRPETFNQAVYNVNKGEILFIDEIQDLDKKLWTLLYKVMEENMLPLNYGGQPVNAILEDFTVLGATTDVGILSTSLVDRFDGGHIQIGNYSNDDIKALYKVRISVSSISETALNMLAKAARGTPRVAVGISKHVNSFINLYSLTSFDDVNASQALELIGIDKYGLNTNDREYIRILGEVFPLRAVAIDTIEGIIGIDKKTIQSDHEPFLMSEGYLIKSGRGRALTDKGLKLHKSMITGNN